MSTISRCFTMIPIFSRSGGSGSRPFSLADDCDFTRTKPAFYRPRIPQRFSALSLRETAVAGCRKKTSPGFAGGIAPCWIGFAPARRHSTIFRRVSPRGSRMPNMPTHGGCGNRSSATGLSACCRSLTDPIGPPGSPGRFLEQQSEEPALREPQQERAGQSQQQYRLPPLEYAPKWPEPRRPWTSRERLEASRVLHESV